jgi:hypothetical protein
MVGEHIQRHDGSFIIRIWWERGEASPGARSGASAEAGHWRGWIQHVRNGKHAYFTSLSDMADFIERETGIQPAGEQAWGLV